MKRILLSILFVLLCAVYAQSQVTTQNARRLPDKNGIPSGSCVSGPPFVDVQFDISTTPPTMYVCKAGAFSATAGGATGAPKDATYIVQIPNSTLTNEQALSLLATGIPLITTTTGAISISSVTNDVQTKAAIVPNTAPSAGQILAGNAGGTAYAPVALSGSGVTATLSSAGVLTLSGIPSATLNLTTTTCTNQFVTAISSGGVGTCTTDTLASAQHANQGTTTTVLHGNASGNPSFGQIVAADITTATITYATIQNLGALAIMGRSANTSGVGADIQAAAASDAVLRESGSTIGFGTIATGGIANNAVTLAKFATQATNTVLANITSGTAVPTAHAVGSCSTAGSALIWTTNSGFGCNTSITAAAVAVGGITGLGTGVATALAINIGTAGSPVTNGGALGSPSTAGTIPAFTLGGTIAGGGNQINNVIIGTSTPLAGSFTAIVGTSLDLNPAGSSTHFLFGASSSATYNSISFNGTQTVASNIGLIGGGGSDKALYLTAPTAGGFNFLINGSTKFSIDASGNIIVVGSTTMNGTVLAPNLATSSAATTGTLCWTTGTGNVNVDTTTTCLLSSAKYKKNDRPLTGGLDTILRLRPVSYFLKSDPYHIGEQEGFFAEDVFKVDPRLVSLEDDGSPHAVRYQQMTAKLTLAIQELNTKVERLENEKTTTHRRSVRHRSRAK